MVKARGVVSETIVVSKSMLALFVVKVTSPSRTTPPLISIFPAFPPESVAVVVMSL